MGSFFDTFSILTLPCFHDAFVRSVFADTARVLYLPITYIICLTVGVHAMKIAIGRLVELDVLFLKTCSRLRLQRK